MSTVEVSMSSATQEPPYSRTNQRASRMSRADCFRALGVAPDASWDGIRQAYMDLVRVWHPDRFQSDPQLQLRAEQQLQRINEAYSALKNAHIFETTLPERAPQPKPAEPSPIVNDQPRTRSGPERFRWSLLFRWPIKAAWLALICLAPLVIGGLLVGTLRVPTLESLFQNGQPRPVILTPSRFVSPSGDGQATADELSNWARGEAMDLWKSVANIGQRPSERLVQAAHGAIPESDDVAPRAEPRQRDTRAVAPGTPANGTELLGTRMSGGSQLWVSNQANQDAVAKLVEADTGSAVRVVYIQARNKACIRHIAPGLYQLLSEVGEDWDPRHLRFQTRRRALDRNGPFQCIDVTSAHVTSGQCIDVSSTDGASRPKYNIVLGTR